MTATSTSAAPGAGNASTQGKAEGAAAAVGKGFGGAESVTQQLAQLQSQSSGKQPSCAEVLAALSTGLPPSALREAAIAPSALG